jgi:Ca2+-binding EF-hand superfamily protein
LCNQGLNIPDSEIDKLIAEADYNNDDKIDYNEFLDMMKRDLKGEAAEEAVKREASLKKQGTGESAK